MGLLLRCLMGAGEKATMVLPRPMLLLLRHLSRAEEKATILPPRSPLLLRRRCLTGKEATVTGVARAVVVCWAPF